jgi:hypothetical protein
MSTKKQYVEYLGSTPKNGTCTYLAEHLEAVSHAVVTDFLYQKRVMPRKVGKLGKDRLAESKESCLSVDDSVQDNRYSRFSDLVRAQSSGNEPRVVRGIGGVSVVHRGARSKRFIQVTLACLRPPLRASPRRSISRRGLSTRSTRSKFKRARSGLTAGTPRQRSSRSFTAEGVWRRGAHARAQVPRSAARRVPVSGWRRSVVSRWRPLARSLRDRSGL